MIKPNDKKHYLISGIFISILLAISMATITMLNKQNAIFSSNVAIKTEVASAQNLKEGAAVQLRGVKIGSVKDIAFKNVETLVITLAVNSTYSEWVKKDASISFKTQGVLGDKFLEINGGTDAAPAVVDGDYLPANETSQIEHIITKSEDIMAATGKILTRLDRILSTVEADRFDKILKNIENLTANSNKVMSSLNDQKVTQSLASLKQSSESLAKITKQVENGPGTLHALIYDQGLHEDLRTLIGGANRSKVLKFFIRESIKKGQ